MKNYSDKDREMYDDEFLKADQALRLKVAKPFVKVREDLAWNKREQRDHYLKRIARIFDILQNHSDDLAENLIFAHLTLEEAENLKDYVCDLITADVERRAGFLATNMGSEHHAENKRALFSYLMSLVMDNFHTYNNPAYMKKSGEYSFLTFIKKYENEAVLNFLSFERGQNKNTIILMNEIRNAKEKIVKEDSVDPLMITKSQVIEKMGDKVRRYSEKYVKDACDMMEGTVNYDDIDKYRPKEKAEDPLDAVENAANLPIFKEILGQLRKVHIYTLMKKADTPAQRGVYEILARDERLRRLIAEDEYYGEAVTIGPNGEISGITPGVIKEIHENTCKRIRRYLAGKGLGEDDLRGILSGLIEETIQ